LLQIEPGTPEALRQQRSTAAEAFGGADGTSVDVMGMRWGDD